MHEDMNAADWQILHDQKRQRRLMKYDLKNRFNLTLEQYDFVNAQQGGLCAICKKKPEKHLAVDAHKINNTPRGLLCNRCKMGLAYFYDDTVIMTAAIKYIDDFQDILNKRARIELDK